LLSSVTWSVGVLTYSRLGREGVSAAAITAQRAFVALPLFFIVGWIQCGGLLPMWAEFAEWPVAEFFWAAVSVIFSYALGDILFIKATVLMGAPAALAVSSVYPVWSAFSGALWKGEALKVTGWGGVLLVFVGLAFVVLAGSTSKTQRSPRLFWMGFFVALLTSVFWSMNTFAISHLNPDNSVVLQNLVRMSVAALVCPLVGRLTEGSKFQLLRRDQMVKTFPVFAFESFFGAISYTYGLVKAPLAVASSLSSLAPVISAPLSWLRREEAPSILKFLGILLVVGGGILLVL
jgi:drug/metabolite transporter (DMT)-like permease